MTFLHQKTRSNQKVINIESKKIIDIQFPNNFELSNKEQFLIKGPLGQISIFLGNAYIKHDNNTKILSIDSQLITPQNLALIKHLNKGLTIGFFIRVYQSGVWTILKKIIPNKLFAFQLGHSHPTLFHIPNHILLKSKRDGQFRTINIFSISLQLVKDTAAKLISLQPADIYKLNGFRYTINTKTKVGKKK